MKSPDLSIVIISYNTKNITKNCLDSVITSLQSSNIPYEIVVVDNNSHDGSQEMLQEFKKNHPDITTLLLEKENIGFGRGNNLGVQRAKGNYILFLNSDTVILDNAIANLFDFYTKHDGRIHFLGAKLLNKDMTQQPSAAYFFTLPVVFAALFLRGDYWGLTRFSPNAVKKVDWISGACIFTKKELFQKTGGFDKDIFMYMEEVDLLYRAKQLGYDTYIYPKARIIHLGSASSEGKTFPILQVYKGFLYFYKKHHSTSALFFLRILLQLKALLAIALGKLKGSTYLVETYEQAYRIASMD